MTPRLTIAANIVAILLLTTKTTIADQFGRGWVELADGVKIEVEIAATTSQREHGLMYRGSLNENQGMLFVFPTEARQAMWMKNMRLPLDVILISEQGRIVEIVQQLAPCQQKTCPVYRSSVKAKYMLEVNAGFATKRHIATNQELIMEYKHD